MLGWALTHLSEGFWSSARGNAGNSGTIKWWLSPLFWVYRVFCPVGCDLWPEMHRLNNPNKRFRPEPVLCWLKHFFVRPFSWAHDSFFAGESYQCSSWLHQSWLAQIGVVNDWSWCNLCDSAHQQHRSKNNAPVQNGFLSGHNTWLLT